MTMETLTMETMTMETMAMTTPTQDGRHPERETKCEGSDEGGEIGYLEKTSPTTAKRN